MFNVVVDEKLIVVSNPDAIRWFDSKKSEIEWAHWDAYKEMLLSQARAIDVIDSHEDVIDNILDYSGDPTLPGPWARKGLVMGNVQSGKTQNYIGLINKAIDAGYKVIILLGGHIVDLRKQTQERVDEGVLGRESRHLIEAQIAPPEFTMPSALINIFILLNLVCPLNNTQYNKI
jgi:primosomal protein N'